MYLIPAILHIVKPKIHSIDKKGRATMGIKLLDLDKKCDAMTICKSYKKYTKDQLILVNSSSLSTNIHSLDRVVGPVSDIKHWNDILPYRMGLPSKKKHRPLAIKNYHKSRGLSPQPTSPHATPSRKFMLVDSPGTVDREDGLWYNSPEHYGVWTIDLPTQLGWTHNDKPAVQILLEHYLEHIESHTHKPFTQSLYLPTYRLPMIDPTSYHCVSEETLTEHHSIPILCINLHKKEVFKSSIRSTDTTEFFTTDDTPSSYPDWFHSCPLFKDTTVADWNITMNHQWLHTIDPKLQVYTIDKVKTIRVLEDGTKKQERYAPITSPVRSLMDFWNQCIFHDNHSPKSVIKYIKIPVIANHIEKMMKRIEVFINQSKIIRYHSSALILSKIILSYEDVIPIFEAKINFIVAEKGAFLKIVSPKTTKDMIIWHKHSEYRTEDIGQIVKLNVSITRRPDPFGMVCFALVDTEKES